MKNHLIDCFNQQHLILIIEDDEISRTAMESHLAKIHNIKYIFAEDGLAGVEKAKRFQPDLIMTDLHMPFLESEALIDKLRETTNHSIPIIGMLGEAFEQSVKDKLDDCFTKPVCPETLLKNCIST